MAASRKSIFWLPHTTELCLHWSPYLGIPFWPCSLLNILPNFPLFHFFGSNSIIVASVTVSKVSNNVFLSFGSHVYLWKSTHAHVQITFNPGLKFQLGLRKPGWKSQPWRKLSHGLKILSCNTKIESSWFLRYHGMEFQSWYIIKISAQGCNLPCNEPLNSYKAWFSSLFIVS